MNLIETDEEIKLRLRAEKREPRNYAEARAMWGPIADAIREHRNDLARKIKAERRAARPPAAAQNPRQRGTHRQAATPAPMRRTRRLSRCHGRSSQDPDGDPPPRAPGRSLSSGRRS